eukprot:6196331-Pleurochrysis_carterae.AAC.1
MQITYSRGQGASAGAGAGPSSRVGDARAVMQITREQRADRSASTHAARAQMGALCMRAKISGA